MIIAVVSLCAQDGLDGQDATPAGDGGWIHGGDDQQGADPCHESMENTLPDVAPLSSSITWQEPDRQLVDTLQN